MFTAVLAIIAPYADIVVAVQRFVHVEELAVQHLLGAKNDGSHEVDLVADYLAALRPHIALHTVVPVLIAYVVAAYKHLLSGDGEDKKQEKTEEYQAFGRNIVLIHVLLYFDNCNLQKYRKSYNPVHL